MRSGSAWFTCTSRLLALTAESSESTLMPRSIAFLSAGSNASLSLAAMAMESTFCAISSSMIWICASAVGWSGAFAITSWPNSAIASRKPSIIFSP